MDYPQYVVRPGDTIYNISRTYHVDMTEMIHLNHLRHPDRLYPGQVLLVPVTEHADPPFNRVSEPNLTYAIWLYDAYAGKESELTTTTAYLYQAVILDRPEFDALLQPIAYDELRHLNLLGQILRQLGVDPRYGSFQKTRWTDWRSRYIHYQTDPCQILERNMRDEAATYYAYMELSQKISIPEIQNTLIQIACEEGHHCQCFANALQQLYGIDIPCPLAGIEPSLSAPPEMKPPEPPFPEDVGLNLECPADPQP
ncbi:MAG: LysM peptidoglycan-binding domain-containing protein [Peptococcaceae bacterium]|jgi:rubrerythrin|nr:LysM peptidoglycan-binding domain-containing protein [Peptococcaceae bacterium]